MTLIALVDAARGGKGKKSSTMTGLRGYGECKNLSRNDGERLGEWGT